jgi:hypothetical protein
MFVVGSIMCGLNYNAGVLYGIELMESRIIECEGYVVNRNIRVTNYICDRIEFCVGDPDGEIYLRMYDGGTCWSSSQPYHMFLSQASTIVMSNFKGKYGIMDTGAASATGRKVILSIKGMTRHENNQG